MEHCDTDYITPTIQQSIQMEKKMRAVQAKLQLDARNAELWSKHNKLEL